VTGYFQARTQEGDLAGVAAFITLDNQTYQILAYTPAQLLGRYDAAFRAAVGSFNRLTDPQALAVQPNRITIVRTPQQMTLAEFNQRYPSVIGADELALINQLAGVAATIPSGFRMKRVIAGG
jgi:predicted Zn-dependent protease